jgi:hypothetical protein
MLALAVAVATWVAGWWAVPVCGAAYGMLRRSAGRGGVAREAAIGAMLAWAALLAYQVSHPAFGPLAAAIGGAIPAPTWVLLSFTVLFAGALAGSAAYLLHDR